MLRDSADTPDPDLPAAGGPWLHVAAGGRELALHFDLVEEVVDPGPTVPIPGAAPWCRGLASVGGQLLTLVDAGLLFGDRASETHAVVVLAGLRVKTALAVDENLLTHGDEVPADRRLDAEELAAHPAFQPGAALTAHAPDAVRAAGDTHPGAAASRPSQEAPR